MVGGNSRLSVSFAHQPVHLFPLVPACIHTEVHEDVLLAVRSALSTCSLVQAKGQSTSAIVSLNALFSPPQAGGPAVSHTDPTFINEFGETLEMLRKVCLTKYACTHGFKRERECAYVCVCVCACACVCARVYVCVCVYVWGGGVGVGVGICTHALVLCITLLRVYLRTSTSEEDFDLRDISYAPRSS